MKIKNNFLKLFLLTVILITSGCETLDLDQTEDPSGIQENLLNPVYVFNYVQLQLPDFVNSANSFTQRMTRQMAMTGGNTYENAFQPVDFNDNWNTAYRMLNAIKIMEPKARESGEFYALGGSRVIRAYVLMTLVDMYGDIPLSEALQGNANLTPKFDKSANAYKQILTELDEAILILQQPNSVKSEVQDLYYTSQDSWITLANTLKLKMYNTARLAGADIGIADIGQAIIQILNTNNYIDEAAEDFAFQYGNSRFSPNARHPMYNDQYELGGGAYIANYYMWAMSTEKGMAMDEKGVNPIVSAANPVVDPRTNYYFCKQDASPAGEDEFTLPGRIRPVHYDDPVYNSFYEEGVRNPYTTSNWVSGGSVPANGYWGRDHGDNSGIPNDGEKRTVGGIYPIGGAFRTTSSTQNNGSNGALGAGIMPILLSSYVHFMLAEAYQELGIGSAIQVRAELEKAINQSIDKVINFKPDYAYVAGTQPTPAILSAQRTSYMDYVLGKFDSLSQSQRLELIIKEYYLAAWGNGIEPYNNYRRTGFPSNFQPTLEPVSGPFFNTALYPGESINNNPNAPNNNRSRRVFWDKAEIVLH